MSTCCQTFNLSNAKKNVELKTFCMPLSTTVVCLNTSKHRLYKRFHGTSMPKLTTGYDSGSCRCHHSPKKFTFLFFDFMFYCLICAIVSLRVTTLFLNFPISIRKIKPTSSKNFLVMPTLQTNFFFSFNLEVKEK